MCSTLFYTLLHTYKMALMQTLLWKNFFLLFPAGCLCLVNVIDTNNGIIEFTPYVSILDKDNQYRYGVTELIPLISKVATRFTRIYIELSQEDIIGEPSNSLTLSPKAAAMFNCLSTTTTKVEVYLGITGRDCNCKHLPNLMQSVTYFADGVNRICSGTLTTILIQRYPYESCQLYKSLCKPLQDIKESNVGSLSVYSWGLMSSFIKYCNERLRLYFRPTIVLITYDKEESMLSRNLTQCKTYTGYSYRPSKFVRRLSFPDTDKNGIVNMTKYMTSWKLLLENNNNMTYLISKAFDTPRPLALKYQTTGWWYLVNDSSHKNLTEFVFKEKQLEFRRVDNQESVQNFKWLQNNTKFDKSSTGIIYSGEIGLDVITNDFCRILCLRHKYISNMIRTIDNVSFSCGDNFQVALVYHESVKHIITSTSNLTARNIIVLVSITETNLNFEIVSNLKQAGIQYGYFISTQLCEQNILQERFQKRIFSEIIQDPDSLMYAFEFEEYRDSIGLGASRMFRRQTVLFEQCQDMIQSMRNTYSTYAFAISRYFRRNNFYQSLWAMQNFVRYVRLLNEWAETRNNVVVYVSRDTDGTRTSFRVGSGYTIGWYTLRDGNYVTKSELALELSLSQYPEINEITNDDGKQNTIIVVICLSIIFGASVVSAAFYFIRRYFNESNYTMKIIDEFYNGNQNKKVSSEYDTSQTYDRNKYEIPETHFKIDEGSLLGSGQFGIVSEGTINTTNGEVNVAVKTTKSMKTRGIVMSGLLSELKILAYLGKHENITKLLGANTASLKNGKIFIFLELCHLGSLEKYLREMRLLSISSVPGTMECFPSTGCTYVNTFEDSITLNISLKNDLFRWSTEICNGMAYLAEKHVVHADLATRNVLLNSHKEAKICDFGLSRRMFNYETYVKSKQEPLPWKWMAPESLNYMHFNQKTDVWAYGITLWEIHSLGVSPYQGISWDVNFVKMLEQGFRLSKPEFDENNLYLVMQSCWLTDPDQRPPFLKILECMKLGSERNFSN